MIYIFFYFNAYFVFAAKLLKEIKLSLTCRQHNLIHGLSFSNVSIALEFELFLSLDKDVSILLVLPIYVSSAKFWSVIRLVLFVSTVPHSTVSTE